MQIEQKQNRIYKPQSNTTLSAEETNQVTTELENVITAGGLTPNAGTLTQVRDAVQNIVDTAANDLQTQIDGITGASDVFDVVGTYAQLQAYDTSAVPLNDIIKVLQDETRDNAMTYYRWNGTAWVFVGEEGPYYTVAETDTKFATKAQLPGIATTAQAGIVKPDNQTIMVQSDGTISATSSILAALPLFTCQFSDHLINNPSYLRADTFSWHSGSVYLSAYQHLVDDISGVTPETETISGTTITFYRATDGHKIVLADQESNADAIYTATGIAWYYVLDTTNQRFKLPRTNFGFTGLRTNVGEYVPETLPSPTISEQLYAESGATPNHLADGGNSSGVTWTHTIIDDVYKVNAPVQQRATQMYLYFYAGNTVIDQTTIDVGEITEEMNGKADRDLSNLTSTGQKRLAGRYVRSYIVLVSSGTIAGGATINFDLSSYLPSDGQDYEVWGSIRGSSNSNLTFNIGIRTEAMTGNNVLRVVSGFSTTANSGSFVAVVGPERILRLINLHQNNVFNIVEMDLVGYRRIGTNNN